VLQRDEVSVLWCLCKCLLDDIFRLLNLTTTGMQVVFAVEVVMDEMVAEGFHISSTARFGGAIGIGRSEVSWILTWKPVSTGHPNTRKDDGCHLPMIFAIARSFFNISMFRSSLGILESRTWSNVCDPTW
jgi:hypothetical protein